MMPPMNEPLSPLQNLGGTAGARELLRGVTLEIPAGGVFGLVGPSGAGKSTLLKSSHRGAALFFGARF